jgi:N-acyl-phosphatidylethanolamine-hydrolysing phospholipase D
MTIIHFKGRLLAVVVLVLLSTATACFAPQAFDEAAWKLKVQATDAKDLYAPHQKPDGEFFNPWLGQEKSFAQLLRWRFSRNSLPDVEGHEEAPRVPNNGAYLKDKSAPDSLTWVGHATFALQWGGQVVLTDPFFSGYAAIVPRINEAGLSIKAIPEGAVVLISHNHYDHLDSDTIEALNGRVKWLCPLGLADYLRGLGAKDVTELDWWQEAEINGTRFTCLPAQHWSRRFGQSYNQTLWCMWLMQRQGRKVLYAADTGYFKGFKEYGRRWPGIDVVLMPVGAYMPRWFMHYAHMNIPEAVQAFKDLGAKVMVPTQWGVIKLGDEPAAYPIKELKDAAARDPQLAKGLAVLPVGGKMLLK